MGSSRQVWFRYLSGPDIEDLGVDDLEVVAAIEDVVAAHARGETVFEPRVHLVPTPQPLVRTEWIGEGVFVVPYGTISAVELDLLDVVDDWRESRSGRFGALRAHVDSGRLSEESLHAQLGQVVTGQRPGRERPEERILLWHRWLSILDVALAHLLLRRAEAADVGTVLRLR